MADLISRNSFQQSDRITRVKKTAMNETLRYPTFVELVRASGADTFFLITAQRLSFLTLNFVTISPSTFSILPGFSSSVRVLLRLTLGPHSGVSAGVVSKLMVAAVVVVLMLVLSVVMLLPFSETVVMGAAVEVNSSHIGFILSMSMYAV